MITARIHSVLLGSFALTLPVSFELDAQRAAASTILALVVQHTPRAPEGPGRLGPAERTVRLGRGRG